MRHTTVAWPYTQAHTLTKRKRNGTGLLLHTTAATTTTTTAAAAKQEWHNGVDTYHLPPPPITVYP